MPGSAPPTTIADIAAACGVSRWTVSAVLFPSDKNQHVGCSEATRAKVLAAAKRLRYRPHRASRNLLIRKHGAIGILTSQFFTIPWTSLHAMLAAAKRHGQVISIESFTAGDEALPLFIRENVIDGLLLYEALAPAIEQAIAHHRIPAVHVNTCQRGKANAINMDEAAAIEQAVAHLAGRGRTQVALIVADGAERFEEQRVAAIKVACKRAGLAAPKVLSFRGFGEAADAQQRLAGFFEQHRACDAMIAPHDAYVGMIYRQCLLSGRRIPEDLALICMQNPDRLMHYDPPVTAFELPEAKLGELAVEMLNTVKDAMKASDEILLPYAFILRAST